MRTLKNNTVYIIICWKKNFVHLIFVGGATHKNFLTTKISPSTVSGHILSEDITRGGGTLNNRLYFHPRPQSRSWPIKFLCFTPWPHQNFGLDIWLSRLTMDIDRLESLWLFLSCPRFLPWPLAQLQNFTLTVWPHFDPGHGWEYTNFQWERLVHSRLSRRHESREVTPFLTGKNVQAPMGINTISAIFKR